MMSENKKIILWSVGAVLIVFCSWAIYWYLLAWRFPELSDRSFYGDAFGSLSALFTGLAVSGVIITLRFQWQQIRESTKAQEDTQHALTQQAEALKRVADLNELNLKFQYYDKRFPFYTAVMDMIDDALEGFLDDLTFPEFERQTAYNHLLFGKKVQLFIKELQTKGQELIDLTDKTAAQANEGGTSADSASPEEKQRTIQQKKQVIDWFAQQSALAEEIFSPYLKVTE